MIHKYQAKGLFDTNERKATSDMACIAILDHYVSLCSNLLKNTLLLSCGFLGASGLFAIDPYKITLIHTIRHHISIRHDLLGLFHFIKMEFDQKRRSQ